jgi:hypothetical protein
LRGSVRWLMVFVFALASVHFARCYVTLTGYWINLSTYAAGMEKMPFQGRMLMMFPLRWAEHNGRIVRFASHQHGAMQTPDLIVTSVVALFGLVGTGVIVTHMYREVSRLRLFGWLPYALLLAIAFFNYVLHCEQNFLYPYDLLSLLFFTAGVWLIYARRFWWLVLLFPVATLNRETIVFLVPLLVLDACCEEARLNWKKLRQPSLWAKAALLLAIWEPIELYVRHRFRNNPTDLGSHIQVNLLYLSHPQYWPQLLSMGAYLPLFVFFFRGQIEDFRLRIYCWIFPLWYAVMFYFGMLDETRIFGELGGLLALVSALIFERRVWSMVSRRRQEPVAASAAAP